MNHKYKSIELGRSFKTKDELFEALKNNVDDIISIKRKKILKSSEKGAGLKVKPIDYSKLLNAGIKEIAIDDDFYYIAVNSTNVLDSHNDLHLPKIWKKSIKEQQGKLYLVDSHVLSIVTTIARKENIEVFTAVVPFSVIGKDYKGTTEILIYKVPKDKVIHEQAKEWLESGDAIEASVRMQYVDLVLCANSDRREDKTEKKNFDKYISEVANKEDFEEEIYYFFAIKEAKNVSESSLVLFGSNSSTGQLIEESVQRSNKSLDKQAAKALEEQADNEKRKQFYINRLKK